MLTASKEAFAGDMKSTLSNSGHDAWGKAVDAKNEISDTAQTTLGKMRGYMNTAGEEISHAGETVTKTIRSNPVKSSAIALGVGFVIARLLRL